MADKITSLEVEIKASKAAEIAQDWAAETKFSIHEKNGKRIVFIKKIRLTWAWLVIEDLGTKVKLSAWIGAKNLGPEEKGSFWKGNKIPIPTGFAFGPAGVYQKYFNRLLGMLKNDLNDPSGISIMQNANPQVLTKDSLAKGIFFLGITIFLSGALSIFNGVNMAANQMLADFAKTSVQSGAADMVNGVVLFFSSRLMKNGKALSIWLYGATVLFSIGQDLAMGADIPFFTILFGVLIISQMLGLKRQGQLA